MRVTGTRPLVMAGIMISIIEYWRHQESLSINKLLQLACLCNQFMFSDKTYVAFKGTSHRPYAVISFPRRSLAPNGARGNRRLGGGLRLAQFSLNHPKLPAPAPPAGAPFLPTFCAADFLVPR